jgi:hypothetical protein
MAKYDSAKDEVLAEVGKIEGEKTDIVVRLVSYDGAPAKLAINRSYETKKGEERVSALGRVTYEEAMELLPLVNKAVELLGAAAKSDEEPAEVDAEAVAS